jgi:nickel-dependent lactate racemase
LPYGTGEIELEIPPERLCVAATAEAGETLPPLHAFRQALDEPLDSAPLEELAAGRTVALLVDDATRSEPHREFIRAMLERLTGAELVHGIIATGSHRRDTEGNRRIIGWLQQTADELGVELRASIHDCEDPELFETLGSTSRGTPVAINRRVMEADVIALTSDVKNHYFAGYSNPLKNLLPGVSSFAGVEHNHSFALEEDSTFGRHPWHPDEDRRTNPVAQDMLEAFRMATAGRDVFSLASVMTSAGLVWAGAGDPRAVTEEGVLRVDRVAAARVQPADRLIVCPGGDPQDETLYNAQRGLELSRNGVRDGGEVLFVARCPDGVAPTPKARAEFYDRLTRPLEEVIRGLEERYVLYSHKAYKFARLLQDTAAIHMATDLPAEQVEAAHMRKVADPQALVDRWLAESDGRILVNPYANKLALYR